MSPNEREKGRTTVNNKGGGRNSLKFSRASLGAVPSRRAPPVVQPPESPRQLPKVPGQKRNSNRGAKRALLAKNKKERGEMRSDVKAGQRDGKDDGKEKEKR